MPTFSLEERDLAWVDRAPVLITKSFTLGAPAAEVWNAVAGRLSERRPAPQRATDPLPGGGTLTHRQRRLIRWRWRRIH